MATNRKKTLYEILDVRKNATYPEITAAHQQLLEKIQSQKERMSAEDLDFRQKVVQLAFQTLSTPISRDAYDAKLASQCEADVGVERPNPFAVQIPANATPADALSFKAEAISLRAEAMSLRAEALSLRAGGAPVDRYAVNTESMGSMVMPMVKKVIMVLGTLVAVSMVIQVANVLLANKRASDPALEDKAKDKVALQEYYQTHGIRPGGKTEADLLDVKNRREENEQRLADREKQVQAEKTRRFEDDARRAGERASAEIARSEEQFQNRTRVEDEQLKFRKEQEKRRQEDIERMRIENEKAQWRAVLSR